MVKQHNQLMISLLIVGDLVSLLLAWVAGYALRLQLGVDRWELTDLPMPPARELLGSLLLSMALLLVVFSQFRLYQPKRLKNLFGELFDVSKAVVVIWAMTYVAGNFLQRTAVSRVLMASLLVCWLVIAIAGRISIRSLLRWFRRRGFNMRTAAIIGTGRLGQKVYHSLQVNTWTGIEMRYFVSLQGEDEKLFSLPVHGGLDSMERAMREQPVDMVFVALPTERFGELDAILQRLSSFNLDVRVIPDLLAFHFLQHDVSQLDNMPIIALSESPLGGWGATFKRAFDIVVALVALAVLAVPMLIIAAAIKLTSRGPVFYVQQRTSIGGRDFPMLKFRSMTPDAEDGTGPVMATRNDPRVTRVGRLLRSTSLDELPQLFNVLIGHMSLVGPRPERPELIEQFRKEIPHYMFRLQVKAGLTGWAQANRLRGETPMRKRIQYDLYYVSHWSFGLDLRIIVMTIFGGMANPNAY